jgi:hypothetical protein
MAGVRRRSLNLRLPLDAASSSSSPRRSDIAQHPSIRSPRTCVPVERSKLHLEHAASHRDDKFPVPALTRVIFLASATLVERLRSLLAIPRYAASHIISRGLSITISQEKSAGGSGLSVRLRSVSCIILACFITERSFARTLPALTALLDR